MLHRPCFFVCVCVWRRTRGEGGSKRCRLVNRSVEANTCQPGSSYGDGLGMASWTGTGVLPLPHVIPLCRMCVLSSL